MDAILGRSDILLALGLGLARTLPVLWLLPISGGIHVPPPVRVVLALLLSLLNLPQLTGAMAAFERGSGARPALVLVVARELLVGVTVGLVVAFVFRAAESAGRLVDLSRGATTGDVLSPLDGERNSPMGDLYLILAITLFLEIGGLRMTLRALAESYAAVPVAKPLAIDAARSALLLVGESSARVVASGVALAAPVITALWLTDLLFGAIARFNPQLPIYFVAMPMKALIGIAMVLVGLVAIQRALPAQFVACITLVARALAVRQ